MSAITINGTIVDSSGTFPDAGGTIEFLLDKHYKRSDGKIAVPKVESASLSAVDGTFSIVLESTRDGVPSTRYYRVMVKAKFGGVPVNWELGKIQIRNTPSPQTLQDLIVDALLAETVGRDQHDWSDAATSDVGHITGTIDGSNRVFVLSKMPLTGLEAIFVNEVYAVPGVAYAIAGDTITFTLGSQPLAGEKLNAFYPLA
jgi:hypothetical protein